VLRAPPRRPRVACVSDPFASRCRAVRGIRCFARYEAVDAQAGERAGRRFLELFSGSAVNTEASRGGAEGCVACRGREDATPPTPLAQLLINEESFPQQLATAMGLQSELRFNLLGRMRLCDPTQEHHPQCQHRGVASVQGRGGRAGCTGHRVLRRGAGDDGAGA
jgi:hypothetical protein